MVSDQYRRLYSKLNKEQKEAVDTIEGPVMVIAGPGTGKTQIIILRIANILLQTQVNPENILALTFTESAALEMRKRLVDLIGTLGYRVEVSTFHSFCNEIILSHSEDFPHLVGSENITEVEQIQLIERLIDSTDLKLIKPFGDPFYYLKQIISDISNLKKEGVSPDGLEKAVDEQKKDFDKIDDLYHQSGRYKGEMKGKYQDLKRDIEKLEEFLIIFKKYQNELKKLKKYDFNDMLLEVKIALEKDKSLLLRFQEKYQYILVDEHQDTNSAQNKIIELLANFFDNPNLFVVGDEKQAIFRFQGASLENFLYFQKIYKEAKVISLKNNYRSIQSILDASGSLISKNITSELLSGKVVKLISQNTDKSLGVKIARLNDYFAEYELVAEKIAKKKEIGVELSEMAVISRNNRDLYVMAQTLERFGIPYNIRSDQNLLEDLMIQKLLFILRAVNNLASDADLLRALHIDLFKIDPINIYKLISYSRDRNLSVYESLKNIEEKNNLGITSEELASLKKAYESFKRWDTKSHNEGLESLFVSVVEDSGLRESILSSEKRYELLDKLISLFEQIKALSSKDPLLNLEKFLNYIDLCIKHDVSLSQNAKTVIKSSVNLMTAHRSKGLEFDYVYIINAFDSHWGNSKKRFRGFKIPWDKLGVTLSVEGENSEDERRLFYVAMTRARKEVLISYSGVSIDGKEQIPCQFIEEIDPKLVKVVDTKGFEEDFLKNKDTVVSLGLGVKQEAKNKEFFRELFISRGLSPTALDNYLKCPWKFFYRNLLLFPDVKDPNLIFGTAIHFALDSYIKNRLSRQLGLEFLLKKFTESVNKEVILQKDKNRLIEKGQRTLKGYLEEVIPTWGKNIESELRVYGVKIEDGIILNGRLDMIELLDNSGDVVVHDFKTGKPRSRGQIDGTSESSDYNYLRQLMFYKILLDKYKNGLMRMKEGVIDFVEPDDKGRFKSEKFVISDEQARTLERQIIFYANEIINLEFWDRRCDDKNCEYCKLREMTLR